MGKWAVLQSSHAPGDKEYLFPHHSSPPTTKMFISSTREVKNKAKSLMLLQKSMVSPRPACGVPPTQKEYDRTKRYNTERKMHKYIEWLLCELRKLGFFFFLLRKQLAERKMAAAYRMTTVTQEVNRKDQLFSK